MVVKIAPDDLHDCQHGEITTPEHSLGNNGRELCRIFTVTCESYKVRKERLKIIVNRNRW